MNAKPAIFSTISWQVIFKFEHLNLNVLVSISYHGYMLLMRQPLSLLEDSNNWEFLSSTGLKLACLFCLKGNCKINFFLPIKHLSNIHHYHKGQTRSQKEKRIASWTALSFNMEFFSRLWGYETKTGKYEAHQGGRALKTTAALTPGGFWLES